MLAAIDFNDQFVRAANEISDIGAQRHLPCKLVFVELTILEFPPQQAFRIGLIAAKVSREGYGTFGLKLAGMRRRASSPLGGEVPSKARR